MKKITYLIVATGLLWACSKEIEIQKNTDTSWEIDKKIQDDDIRNTIGYDPRFDYVYFPETISDIPMLSLGEVPLVGKNTKTITLQKTGKTVQEDLQVTLSYDASIFESIKDKYTGFELGDASLVKISESTKTMTKEMQSVTFQINTENDSKLNKKLIIPFSVKANNEKVKGVTGKDYFVVKIFPEKVEVTPEATEIEAAVNIKNGVLTIADSEIRVTLKSSKKLPSGIKVGLVRDAASLPNGEKIAPTGVEGTLPKVDFEDRMQNMSFNLDITKLPVERASYVLPLKWLVYDNTGKSYELNDNVILVTIGVKDKVLTDNPNNSVGSNGAATGTRVPFSAISFKFESQTSTGHPEAMVDGKETVASYFNALDQYLYFGFDKERIIKSIRIKAAPTHTIGSCAVYASSDDDFKEQGTADFTEVGGIYTITFKESIPVKNIALGEFFSQRGGHFAWYEIYEVEFYEE